MQRPDGLLGGLRPLVLRFAPDRRRGSGDVQPGAAPGLSNRLVVRQGFDLLVSDLMAWVAKELFNSTQKARQRRIESVRLACGTGLTKRTSGVLEQPNLVLSILLSSNWPCKHPAGHTGC
jgi:hypothetical protein